MGKIIGIDLGTTNSVVAIMEGKEPKVIVNEEGGRLTPSVVAWDDKGEVLVGQIAKRQAITNPENTVYSVKRFMGRRFEEVSEEAKRVPYKVVRAARTATRRSRFAARRLTPPEVSAQVLQKLKKAAEDYLGEKVTEAVITVPAYFNDAQRQATKDAGRIAGLDVKRIVNEPTAAALAYGLDKRKDELIAVYDFGGGTFDISILEVGENVVEVISTNGDTHLGGDDIDQRRHGLADRRVQEGPGHRRLQGQDGHPAPQGGGGEGEDRAVVGARRRRSTCRSSPPTRAARSTCRSSCSRAKLEQMMAPLVERSMEPTKKALADASKKPADIDEVVLVGGSTRIPLVQKPVKEFFGKEPHKGVNPDEVVALGAAVQAGVLSGDVKDMLLLDVTPLSLGIETLGGVMTTLIPRNTTIPTQEEGDLLDGGRQPDLGRGPRAPGRAADGARQPHARQVPPRRASRRRRAACRRSRSRSTSTPTASSTCRAKDKATGKEQQITITASSGLTEARDREDGEGRAGARGRGQEAPRGDRGAQQARVADLPGAEAPRREQRQDCRGRSHRAGGRAQGGQGDGREQPRAEGGRSRSRARSSGCRRRRTRWPRRCTAAPRARRRGGGAPAGEARAPPPGRGGGKDDVIDAEYTEGPKNT